MKKSGILAILVIAIIGIAVFVLFQNGSNPEERYNEALSLIDEDKTEEAYEILVELRDYKDSMDLATEIFKTKHFEALNSAEVGEYITFGSYEQDNDLTNGAEDIKWLVLDKQGQSLLVISKYALDCLAYDSSNSTEDITWEDSYIRRWLNRTFLQTAFDIIEEKGIESVRLSDDKDNQYEEDDKVFLLSAKEAGTYFRQDKDRQCIATDYAKAMGVHTSKRHIVGDESLKTCNWWLRSIGDGYRTALCVFGKGNFGGSGNSVNDDYRAVRPAVWIDVGAFEQSTFDK